MTDSQGQGGDPNGTDARNGVHNQFFPHPYQSLNPDGEILTVNEAWEALLGYNRAEVVGVSFCDFLSADSTRRFESQFAEFKTKGTVSGAELELVRADGGSTVVEFDGNIEYDESGTVRRTHCQFREISDLRDRKEDLKRFEAYIEELNDMVTVLDAEGRVTFQSESTKRRTGMAPGDVVGQSGFEFTHPDDREHVRELFLSVQSDPGSEASTELRVETASGNWRWIEARGVNKLDDQVIEGIVISSRDITERKRRELALSELHRAATDLSEVETPNAVYTHLVESAEEILDFALVAVDILEGDELVQKAWSLESDSEGYYESTPLDTDTLATRAFKRGESIIADDLREYDITPADPDYLSALTVPIGDQGTFQTVARKANAYDATDRELAELLVAHAASALDRLEFEATLRDQQSRLQRKNDRLAEFTEIVSHDIRNPLTVAQGRMALVDETCESDQVTDVLGALDRMEEIIEDALTLARLGQEVGGMERIETVELVNTCWDNVDTDASKIELEDEFAIHGDRSRLKHLFENLFRNAIEHGGDSVTVTVGCADENTFYIEDDGPGIPKAKREKIFAPSYGQKTEGTGLGLTIVQRIAEAHGWEITVKESESGGTRFEFSGMDIRC